MPRRPSRSIPTVIIAGRPRAGGGEKPGPWQSWLAEQLRAADREVRWVDLAAGSGTSLAPSLAKLRATLTGLADDSFDVIGHCLGAILWLHHVATASDSPRAARVALVSPPTASTTPAEFADYFPVPLDVDLVRHCADGTVLVGGSDDPFSPDGVAMDYGRPLKMATTVIEGGGHLTEESGFGEWPAVLDWCRRDNLAFY